MSRPKPKRAPLQRAFVDLRKRLGHTQESFSRELGVSLPTVGKWESNGRLPLDIMLARLSKIAEDAGHPDLAAVFMGGLEELREDRAQRANDIFEEIGRWHDINGHLKWLGEKVEELRLRGLEQDAQQMVDRLVAFEKVLASAQRWSWRNR